MAPVSRPPPMADNNRREEAAAKENLSSQEHDNENNNFNNTTASGRNNPLFVYQPFFAEYSVTAEFNLFAQQNLPGVYCIPSESSPHEWFGVLFLRQGIYQGAILRFLLKLPADFPDNEAPPSIVFDIPIFHPDVDPETGELNVRRGFPTWKSGIHHAYQVLIHMQRCFFTIDCSDPILNADAADLYREDVEKYREKAVDSVRRSREVVYDDPPRSDDPNAIKFTPWDPSLHEQIRARILKSMKSQQHQNIPETSTFTAAGGGADSSLQQPQSASSSTSDLVAQPQASLSSSSLSSRGRGECSGLSFFDDKTFSIMAREKTWAAPAGASQQATLVDLSDIMAGGGGGDKRKGKKKEPRSSSKSKLAK